MIVDIVVGGQYGDEGKGQICAHLAVQKDYDFAVRVGGSNAEHRFMLPNGDKHTARVLPVAAWTKEITSILGPGHMIKLETFIREVKELYSLWGRDIDNKILIDKNAGVIENSHVKQGKETAWRGSTHQGTGQAVAHKVIRDGKFKTAKDYPELERYVTDTIQYYQQLDEKAKGIIEGSQGALLSLNHGYYPFCTSKDTTPAALLAEAGLPLWSVRNIYAVYRAVPMRVPGNSGPTGGHELSWKELEKAIGKTIPETMKKQTDSGSYERVFLWSWKDFKKSLILNGPTAIVLTFTDWWPEKLMGYGVEELVDRINACGTPVVMKRFGPNFYDYDGGAF